ncbi:MAG: hypothetical protein AB7O97_01290 [Planctomycetota bacterium]
MRTLLAFGPLCGAAAVRAQHPALSPTSDTTIVVSGPLHYSSISVPAGVTVRFTAPGFGPFSVPGMPAVVFCDGDAIVHGKLALEGEIINDSPAGWVFTGQGRSGSQCALNYLFPPEGGRHASNYGSVLPFSLEGGSPSGENYLYDAACIQLQSRVPGAEGGGTLVLLADGRIEVAGTITADGHGVTAGGSGGSILLRGAAGVTILPGGSVTARGGPGAPPLTIPPISPPLPPDYRLGEPGYVRLDAWGALPAIQGTVEPPPTALALPHLRSVSQPSIGTTWTCSVFAPENSAVFVAASPNPDNGTPTPFGPLGIDVASATILAWAAVAPSGHDPFVSTPASVPNAPVLVGLGFWTQALVFPPALPARLSNTLSLVVQ